MKDFYILIREGIRLITLFISNKKEFKHFFKSRSSDIVLLKLGNLNQNAKRYEARNTEREARRTLGRAPYRRAHSRRIQFHSETFDKVPEHLLISEKIRRIILGPF